MQGQLQSRFQKHRYFRKQIFQIFLALVQNNEIIRISNVVCDFQISFQKMIELVHVDVHQKLAGKITQRQTDMPFVLSMKTSNDFSEEPYDIFICNSTFQNTQLA